MCIHSAAQKEYGRKGQQGGQRNATSYPRLQQGSNIANKPPTSRGNLVTSPAHFGMVPIPAARSRENQLPCSTAAPQISLQPSSSRTYTIKLSLEYAILVFQHTFDGTRRSEAKQGYKRPKNPRFWNEQDGNVECESGTAHRFRLRDRLADPNYPQRGRWGRHTDCDYESLYLRF